MIATSDCLRILTSCITLTIIMRREDHLLTAIENDSQELVLKFLADPTIDVNRYLVFGKTFLNSAIVKQRTEIIKQLLKHPKIDVNIHGGFKFRPIHIACHSDNLEILTLFLQDPRIDINAIDANATRPIRIAYFSKDQDQILMKVKLIIGYKGRQLEIPRICYVEQKHPQVKTLLEEFKKDRDRVIYRIQLELGLTQLVIDRLFVLVVLHSDQYLRLNVRKVQNVQNVQNENRSRFFKMVSRFPMELQMIICYRVFGSNGSNITGKAFEQELRALVLTF